MSKRPVVANKSRKNKEKNYKKTHKQDKISTQEKVPTQKNKKSMHKDKLNNNKKQKHPKYVKDESEEKSDFDIEEVDDFEAEDNQIDNEYEEGSEEDEEVEVKPKVRTIDDKTKQRLKKKIVDWLDYDDKIKTLNEKTKKYKDAKKQQEELIIKMLTKLEMGDTKIDVTDNKNNFRSRVYRHKSVTKEALKENIIKDALMEAIHDEKKVDQLVKKIDSKRPIKERYYLKRTKGNKN
jgi:hypothetical protein